MSDRTPEQVVQDALRREQEMGEGFYEPSPGQLPDHVNHRVMRTALEALRAEGMLVEEGEVKVRLDGLEERINAAFMAEQSAPGSWSLNNNRSAIAARVVRGETQEANRD